MQLPSADDDFVPFLRRFQWPYLWMHRPCFLEYFLPSAFPLFVLSLFKLSLILSFSAVLQWNHWKFVSHSWRQYWCQEVKHCSNATLPDQGQCLPSTGSSMDKNMKPEFMVIIGCVPFDTVHSLYHSLWFAFF